MSGIYIHIPFCKKACHYCNFHFSTSLKLKNDFLEGLLKEIELRKNYLQQETVNTIYFGGGTPSLLDQAELDVIFNTLHKFFTVDPQAEITFEANPDDVTADRAQGWKETGINRLSLGVQSFYQEDLRWMNRAHTSGQALESVKTVQKAGFDNITIDLIYGSPGLSDEKWSHNVQQALELDIPHLSCYALTVEPQTALANMIMKKKSLPVHSEDQARQFLLLMDWLSNAGFEHYEISNFSKPGKRSRHNSSYWSGEPYLGLGPSAHSYNGMTRQWNVANNLKYNQALQLGVIPCEIEELSFGNRHNEFVMISLRKSEGINKSRFAQLFGEQQLETLAKGLRKYAGKVEEDSSSFRLTREGKLFADGIAGDVFV